MKPDATETTSFDRYAANYQELLNRSVSISGESGKYFAEVKACYLAAVLGSDFDGRVLDFGCGIGLLSNVLLQYMPAAKLDGYDPSEACILSLNPELTKHRRFTAVRDDLRCDYDAVVVANVIHHVPPRERLNTVEFLAERLSSKGRLLIFEHNPANPLTRLAVYRCPFDDDAVLLWPSEVRNLLRRAGLRCMRQNYLVFFPRFLQRARFLEKHMNWCPLGAQYVVSGMKG